MPSSKPLRAGLVAAVFAAGLTAAAGPGFATAAVSKVQDVFITNDSTSAVPTRVTGTTRVDATGQMLTIGGTADVSGSKVDASGSTITVQGRADDPVPVTVTNQPGAGSGSAPVPFQIRAQVSPQEDAPAGLEGLFGSKVVKRMGADERLTITHVSGGGGSTRDALTYLRIADHCDVPTSQSTVMPVLLQPNAEGAWPVVNQAVTFEVGPGKCVDVELRWREPAIQGQVYGITLTGFITKAG
jgi:hypothetical protein